MMNLNHPLSDPGLASPDAPDASETTAVRVVDDEGRPRPWTVGELAEFLSTQDRDRLVVLSSDAEGNAFRPLLEVEVGPSDIEPDPTYGWYATDLDEGRPAVTLIPFD